jgi:hypothetical protein
MCPHTPGKDGSRRGESLTLSNREGVSSYLYICVRIPLYVPSYYCMCVLILLCLCPHTPGKDSFKQEGKSEADANEGEEPWRGKCVVIKSQVLKEEMKEEMKEEE